MYIAYVLFNLCSHERVHWPSNSYSEATIAATTHCKKKIIENFDTEADRILLWVSPIHKNDNISKGKSCQWSLLFLDSLGSFRIDFPA